MVHSIPCTTEIPFAQLTARTRVAHIAIRYTEINSAMGFSNRASICVRTYLHTHVYTYTAQENVIGEFCQWNRDRVARCTASISLSLSYLCSYPRRVCSSLLSPGPRQDGRGWGGGICMYSGERGTRRCPIGRRARVRTCHASFSCHLCRAGREQTHARRAKKVPPRIMGPKRDGNASR